MNAKTFLKLNPFTTEIIHPYDLEVRDIFVDDMRYLKDRSATLLWIVTSIQDENISVKNPLGKGGSFVNWAGNYPELSPIVRLKFAFTRCVECNDGVFDIDYLCCKCRKSA